MKIDILAEESVQPPCSHFGVCGGCRFQHVPYHVQLNAKQSLVESRFSLPCLPIISSDPHWRYRNKMEFSFSQSRDGQKFLGLMKSRGRVENLSECYLTSPWFSSVLTTVRAWWQNRALTAYHPPTNQGLLRTLTLREGIRTGEKMVMLTTSDLDMEQEDIESFVEALGEVHSVILRKQIIQKKIPTRFEERLLAGNHHIHELLYDVNLHPFRFRIRGPSFFQPNTFQAECIYQMAVAMASLDPSEQVLDLYCGTGSIGIFASRYVGRVLGIEIVAEAIQDAHANLALNGISNMELLEGDVGEVLGQLPFKPTTVFVDPPRVGLGAKTIAHLLALQPEKIVYVSCNPVSQAADCAALVDYTLAKLQPIDQFPHTPHVENIALLIRQ